jgi:hypothetical protein
VTATITDEDRGWNAVAARLARAYRVRVGVLDDAPKRGGGPYSLLEVAAVHEFGAPAAGIPQRSFVRAPIDAARAQIQAAQATLARQIVQGKVSGAVAMQRLGALAKGVIQKAIAQGIEPPLLSATVERKGSSTPLVDTGQLRSSIAYRVEKDGGR